MTVTGRARGDEPPRSVAGLITGCTLATGVGAALGFVPGYVARDLQDDLSISRGAVGLLVSLYFGSTGLFSWLAGSVTHRLGPRRAVVGVMTVVAGCAAIAATVSTYVALVVTSLLAGAGYALVNTATNAVLGAAVAPNRRTTAMSIKTAGVPVMATVAASVTPAASERWSWQAIWWTVGGLAAVVGVAVRLLLPADPPRRDPVVVRRARPRPPAGLVWFAIGSFLLVGGSQPLFSWLVRYLEERFDASAAQAGLIAAVATALGAVRLVANGPVADRRGAGQRLRQVSSLSLLTGIGVLLVVAGQHAGIIAVAIGATIGIASQLAAIGTMHAAIVDRAPDAVAAATGVTMTGYYLGALVSPAAFGALVDLTDTYSWGWSILCVMLLAASAAWMRADRVLPAETGHLVAVRVS